MKKEKQMQWTQFMDMHSGGGSKEKWEHIYIEAPEDEAKVIFYNRFGHSPERVTCTCCGDDYSLSEYASLREATAYQRNCEYDSKKQMYVEKQEKSKMDIRKTCKTKDTDKWGLYIPLEEYLKSDSCLVIYKKDIKQNEKKGEVPTQGYVWQ